MTAQVNDLIKLNHAGLLSLSKDEALPRTTDGNVPAVTARITEPRKYGLWFRAQVIQSNVADCNVNEPLLLNENEFVITDREDTYDPADFTSAPGVTMNDLRAEVAIGVIETQTRYLLNAIDNARKMGVIVTHDPINIKTTNPYKVAE